MKQLIEMQKRFQELLQKINGYQAKADAITEDEAKDFDSAIVEAEGLKAQIEEASKRLGRMEDLRKFHEDPSFKLPISAAPEAKAEGGEREGTDLLAFDPETGRKRIIDGEGWAINAKTFLAISQPEYRKAWCKMLRTGRESLDELERKALAEGTDSDGGYLVPPEILARIVTRKPHPTEILSNITRIATSRDRVMFPKFKYTTDDIASVGLAVQWTGETGTTTEDTSLQNWGQVEIPIHAGSFEIQASEDIIEDSAFNLEAFMVQKANEIYALTLDNVIVSGNGVAKPAGILLNPGAADQPATANVGNPATADNILAWFYGLPPQYATNAKVLLNRTSVYATWAQLKDTANNYIGFLRSNTDGGLATARLDELLGAPCIFSAYMPSAGAGNKVAVYGDFKELYTLAERLGLSVKETTDRDVANQGKRSWRFRFRVGGMVIQDRAAKVAVQS